MSETRAFEIALAPERISGGSPAPHQVKPTRVIDKFLLLLWITGYVLLLGAFNLLKLFENR